MNLPNFFYQVLDIRTVLITPNVQKFRFVAVIGINLQRLFSKFLEIMAMGKNPTESFHQSVRAVICTALITILANSPQAFSQDNLPNYIGVRLQPQGDPRVSIFAEEQPTGMHLGGSEKPVLRRKLSSFKRKVVVDSTSQFINFSETFFDTEAGLPSFLTLSEYIELRRKIDAHNKWKQRTLSLLTERGRTRSGGGALRIDIPVEIKSQAFQKIFGGGKVGLDVTGNIGIKGGFRHEKRSEVKTALTRGSDYNFKMEQTQQFRVQGHVGEKVTVMVDQDSERAFDFDNNIRLKYEGFEDEIIQSIEAGNIALSLPGTRFVTFSGKSSGLFGIKTDMTVGNLKFTAIASQEKGESKKMTLQGGATSDAKRIEDYNYKKGTYFFLSHYYRDLFKKYSDKDEHEYSFSGIITSIELYKSEAGYQSRYSDSIRGWACIYDSLKDKRADIDTNRVPDADHYRGYFRRLEKTDYFIDTQLGFIQMNMPLMQGEVLGVAYRDSLGQVFGDIDFDPNTHSTIRLVLIKPEKPRPVDTTWDLEWKNVYDLGGRNISEDGFSVKIFYKPPSGDPQETYTTSDGKTRSYLYLFGLDRFDQNAQPNPDNQLDMNWNIISLARGELIFPDLRPFDPEADDFWKKLPDDKRNSAMYDTTVQSAITSASKFYIEVTSKNRSSEYRLGFNIIEDSEEVRLGGNLLIKGIDYTIDYFSGTLKILNEQATQPNARLDVTWESNQLFQIEKKTVMGARAQYDLWDDGFIGATFLYLNERTLQEKIRVGKGPMRNMVWDVNGAFNLKPQFLTRAVNYLPFVDSRTPSTLKFEGEIAQVIPNPNTKNNEATGDPSGVAYIDDFEAAKKITPLTIGKGGWTPASPPVDKYKNTNPYYPYPFLLAKGKMIWYNPFDQLPIKQIWPNKDVNANVPQRTNVLDILFTPSEDVPAEESWDGLLQDLSAGYANQTESKYLEIWINGDTGTVHIDLGQISEDVIPNSKLDTEDKAVYGIRNGILDDDEDIGLDGMADNDPRAIEAGGDFWDINGNGVKDYGEPFSNDNWSYSSGSSNYRHVNGTEGNRNDPGGRYPDTEDINGNGDVDLRNDYFEYTFHLEKDHPDTVYLVGGKGLPPDQDYGWRQYRIPLDEPTKKVGSPDLSLVEYVRIWFDGFPMHKDKPYWIRIAEINLVGSEWTELGVASPGMPDQFDATDDSTVTIAVVNTHDNPDYQAPPGVSGEVDRITRVQAKEQSLVMRVNNLLPGYTGLIQKSFYEAQNYIRYRKLKMYVYGKDTYGRHINTDSSNVEFFLRFGSDANNYYQVRERVYEGWDERHRRNDIEVDLLKMASLKLDPANYDSVTQCYREVVDGKIYTIKGRPSLTNIRMLFAGVKNLGYQELGLKVGDIMPFTGEIWINELRLSDVKKEKGMAMRARLDFKLADLITLNGQITKQDADFHNVATRFGDGNHSIAGDINVSVNLDQFLPKTFGLSIPINANYSKSEQTPKYKPGTDVEVTDAMPDSILEEIRTVSEKRGFSVSLRKNTRSNNFFIKHTLDRLSLSYSETESHGSTSTTKSSDSKSQSGDFGWDVQFGQDNYIKPFAWLGDAALVSKLSGMKIYYTPSRIVFKMSGTKSLSESLTRTGVESKNETFNVRRDAQATYKLFDNLTADYSRNYTHDLCDIPKDTLMAQLRELRLGLVTSINQNFSVKYNPKLFSWLTNNFNYTAGYKYGYNRQSRSAARSASSNQNMSASLSFNPSQLMKTIYRPAGRGGRGSAKGQQSGQMPRQAPGQKKTDQQDQTKKKKDGDGFSVLGLFAKFFDLFEPFSGNFSQRSNISVYGITDMPVPAFQFGFSDDPGVEILVQNVGQNRGAHNVNKSFDLSSGLRVSRDIKVSFKYNNNWSRNKTTTITGQTSENWFRMGDINMLFPEWSLTWSGLEKLPFISKVAQRVSLSHTRSGQKSSTFNEENGNTTTTKEDFDNAFRPLIGVTLQWKNGMSTNIRFNTSEKTSKSLSFGVGATHTVTSDLSVTANYSKRSDFKIPIPVWPFKNMRLKNNIDLSITFSMSSNVTEKSRGEGEYQVTGETSKWTFRPNLTYSFSQTVNGGAHFEIGKTHNKLVGDSSFKEFGIHVNIKIQGR